MTSLSSPDQLAATVRAVRLNLSGELALDELTTRAKERDEAIAEADGMARAPYGEFESMREKWKAAEARIATLKSALRDVKVISETASIDDPAWTLPNKIAARVDVALQEVAT